MKNIVEIRKVEGGVAVYVDNKMIAAFPRGREGSAILYANWIRGKSK